MRNASSWILLPAGVSLVAALHAGCWSDYDDIYLPLTDPKLVADGGTDGDGDGGKPPACAGDPTQDATLVRDECGVFVSASAAADGDGTKARPFAKLADAIAEAESSGKRAYACAGKAFDESVTISAGIELIGGFDCANAWAWSEAARATVNAPADAIALTIQASATGAKVDGFTLTAVSPSDMKSGKSSIAVAVADVEATLVRCDVVAGDAADGADGSTPTDPVIKGADAPTMGADGSPTDACVLPGGVAGGVPGVTVCDDGMSSGGSGGMGGITGMPDGNGSDGTDGQPTVNTNHGSGATASGDCSDGTKGKGGDAGSAGPGGAAVNDSLTLSGITNLTSTDGQPGTKAQGGGGGGGEKSGVFCKVGSNTIDGPGPSGGGGGGGGCGGKGGGGGKAGGSSIAILSLGTKLSLTSVTLAVGKAGNGGKGANGQAGGTGGHGADGGASSGQAGSIPACNGGDGGLGGAGGPGGGGRGGHAIGIAFSKTPSTPPMVKTFGAGTAGSPGDPGAVGGNNGEQGSAGQCWDFEKHAACGP